jgi:hypothetical protein
MKFEFPALLPFDGAALPDEEQAPEDLLLIAPTLAEQLLAEGWQPGPPAQLLAASMQADLEAAAEYPCPGCDENEMQAQAMHQGERYRIALRCRACLAEAEL